jgi:hypothetical protein
MRTRCAYNRPICAKYRLNGHKDDASPVLNSVGQTLLQWDAFSNSILTTMITNWRNSDPHTVTTTNGNFTRLGAKTEANMRSVAPRVSAGLTTISQAKRWIIHCTSNFTIDTKLRTSALYRLTAHADSRLHSRETTEKTCLLGAETALMVQSSEHFQPPARAS